MHINNDDFSSPKSPLTTTHPKFQERSAWDDETLPGNLEGDLRMLGGDEPADAPCVENFDQYYLRRGPIGTVLPPSDFFARLRMKKI